MLDEIDLQGVGRLLALTSNDEMNSLACLHFTEAFGRNEVYQLPTTESDDETDHSAVSELRGRPLFDRTMSFEVLRERFEAGAQIVVTEFSSTFTYREFQERYTGSATPLFLIRSGEELEVFTVNRFHAPSTGDKMIWMYLRTRPDAETADPSARPTSSTPNPASS